ncbi:MAG: hypothetical protein ABEH59_10015 [Halobacteriales archaeon]
MEARTRSVLRFVGSQLVFVVGLLHLGLGLVNWVRWLGAGFLLPRDFRWPVFVGSGLAVLAGLFLGRRAADRTPYYLAGIAVMLGYVVGYFGWHLSGHRPLLVLGQSVAAETVSVGWFLDHLFAGPVETVAIVAEVLAALTLLALLVSD